MEFKLYEDIKIKDVCDLECYIKFLNKELNAGIGDIVINDYDEDIDIIRDGKIYLKSCWISLYNCNNILGFMELLRHLKEYAHVADMGLFDVNMESYFD